MQSRGSGSVSSRSFCFRGTRVWKLSREGDLLGAEAGGRASSSGCSPPFSSSGYLRSPVLCNLMILTGSVSAFCIDSQAKSREETGSSTHTQVQIEYLESRLEEIKAKCIELYNLVQSE